jgi:eIF-2B alpha/beta/delta-like uncharacterized protein
LTDPIKPPDPDRRRFFRQFAGDMASSVGSVLGAAQLLQRESADAARELLGGEPLLPAEGSETLIERDAATAVWRAPFRWDGDVCRIVDQRRLPDVLVDIEIRGAAEAVTAINEGSLVGAPVQAQVAAVTLAMIAAHSAMSRPFARRATLRGAANALRLARPGSAPMAASLDRMLAVLDEQGLDAEGSAVAAAMADEAARIIGETVEDHGALVGHLLGEGIPPITGEAAEAPLRVLVAGSTGAMGGGQFGTALSAMQTAHHAGRAIHALVPEGRPGLEGARIAAWELRQAGVPHEVMTDAAAPGHIAGGEVGAVLVGADRIAANGDVVALVGAYPLALAAHEAGVPFLVCATTTAIDPALASGDAATLEKGRPGPVLRLAGGRVVPEGTAVRNRLQDLVPAGLVTAIVTEGGVLRGPFEASVAQAVADSTARRGRPASSPEATVA